MTGLVILFMFLGGLLGGRQGMMFAFVVACAMNFVTYWYSEKIVLKMYRARQIGEQDHRQLFETVRRVSTNAQIPMPRVYIVPTAAPNAFATGRSPDNAAVAVTEGLLATLEPGELEGVIGHELAHIQNRDMLIGTIAATFAGAIGLIASVARWGAMFGGLSRSDDDNGGGFALLLTAIVAPLIALVLQMAISRQREFKADAEGARFTGKPEALAAALEKLHRAPVRLNLDKRPATAHLMIANPLSGRGLSALFSTHPKVEDRVRRLKEMATNKSYA
ncbi:MAG: zinc metalloprotease HtpX [candidate division Zixibacteria bacterium]|nr:zinc metalloprotease HtpX [candidate division Zixibacteria bacterium]